MNLNLILPVKMVKVNNKDIKIPKLGLKHRKLIQEVRDLGENMGILLDSICPGLNLPESDFVTIHLLEFNGKLNTTVEKDGFKYDLNNLYMSQRLEFQFSGNIFKFRSPERFEKFTTIDDILDKCLLSVNDEPTKVDFMKMPAFVSKWADDITNTIAVPGPNGPIKGTEKIIRLFE